MGKIFSELQACVTCRIKDETEVYIHDMKRFALGFFIYSVLATACVHTPLS